MPRPVTQKQIAKALGVHPATVCLALKKRPGIPEATRERILAMANQMGYRRDPFLGALSAYRNARRKRAFHGTLAWIVSTAAGTDWRKSLEYLEYYEGARSQAEQLGYRLVIFDRHQYEGRLERLEAIFYARRIRGLIICPQPQANTSIDLDFSQLAAVTFGYTTVRPALHSISSYHYGAIREIFARLRAAGYRRIGYAIPKFHDDRLNGAYFSGYLIEQSTLPRSQQVPPYLEDLRSGPRLPDSFAQWLRRHKPDVLVTVHYSVRRLVDELKMRVPEDLSIALVSVVDGVREFAGIDENSSGLGRVAVDLLASQVERGETGVPANPQRVLIKGLWQDGETLSLRA